MTWEEAKVEVEGRLFPPDDYDFGKDKLEGETHANGKETHSLKTYRTYLPSVGGFSLVAQYNFCPTCKKVRNKFLVLFNDVEDKAYQKWFVKHGEVV